METGRFASRFAAVALVGTMGLGAAGVVYSAYNTAGLRPSISSLSAEITANQDSIILAPTTTAEDRADKEALERDLDPRIAEDQAALANDEAAEAVYQDTLEYSLAVVAGAGLVAIGAAWYGNGNRHSHHGHNAHANNNRAVRLTATALLGVSLTAGIGLGYETVQANNLQATTIAAKATINSDRASIAAALTATRAERAAKIAQEQTDAPVIRQDQELIRLDDTTKNIVQKQEKPTRQIGIAAGVAALVGAFLGRPRRGSARHH